MARKNRLTIPLQDSERKVIDQLARLERLPTATAARRILLEMAAAAGISEKGGKANQTNQ